MSNSDSDSSVYSDLEKELEEEDAWLDDQGPSSSFEKADSSDEEDIRNTIGNIPIKWYEDMEHVGYDVAGRKIGKPQKASEINKFLRKMEDPTYGYTVRDLQTGGDMVLSKDQLDIVQNLRSARYSDAGYDPYQPWVEWFTSEVMQHPILNNDDSKRSFVPSLHEKRMIGRMVHAIRMGWLKTRQQRRREAEAKAGEKHSYDLWQPSSDADQKSKSELSRLRSHIPAPKLKLPGHEESYNPPEEYLFTPEEEAKFNEKDPEEKGATDFVPRKYNSLRLVPGYDDFAKERFQRCLDLYLAPRKRRMRLTVTANELLPTLPLPEDLLPFPRMQAVVFRGHKTVISSISAQPTSGQFLASGDIEGTLKVWEVTTGRCFVSLTLPAQIHTISWCPAPGSCIIAVCCGNDLYLINSCVGDKMDVLKTDEALKMIFDSKETGGSEAVKWSWCDKKEQKRNCRIKITFKHAVKHMAWHAKGDYFATVCPTGGVQSVFIHQLSKCQSQAPFRRNKGIAQKVAFHPTRPVFFVASQRYVRMYDLSKQQLMKKMLPGCRYLSSMAVHPQGDNLLVGSYDSRVLWFDIDLSVKPYQALRHHRSATRAVAYHAHYPLFASASDDLNVVVCHGMVYSDFQNALIVPVKMLKGHSSAKGMGVTDVCFHPTQPWLFSAGADGTIRMYC